MKILVIIKKTPDTETKIRLASNGQSIDHAETKFIINPYDEFAIEEALQIKEKEGGEVVITSFGDPDTKELIIKGLAMGADRGLLISNEGLENADSLLISKVLKGAVESESPDLVLCGKQAIDDDNMHVGPMLAELLGWPHVNVVTKLSLEGGRATAEREIEGGQVEVYDLALPAVIGANKGLNTPRYASLPGIMKAKRKPYESKLPADIGVDISSLNSKAVITKFTSPPEKPPGKVFQGEAVAAMVDKVVNLLREEAKVI